MACQRQFLNTPSTDSVLILYNNTSTRRARDSVKHNSTWYSDRSSRPNAAMPDSHQARRPLTAERQ